MKKKSLQNSRLYVIFGLEEARRAGIGPERFLEEAADGGADMVQFREKNADPARLLDAAQTLAAAARRKGILFILNDDPRLAAQSGADGVHLGQSDGPIAAARRLLGRGKIVGRSTHSLAQAFEAEKEGADYIGFGPVFPTPTKPGRPAVGLGHFTELSARLRIPFFAIGGIDGATLPALLERGVRRIAVIRAATPPAARVRSLKDALKEKIHADTV